MHRFASVALVDPRGWLLLQERDEHAQLDPERWGFPGGGVEQGESWADAAYRELAEETGVVLDGGLELLGEWRFLNPVCGTEDDVRLYVAGTDRTDADIVCGEGRRMVFVAPARARELNLTTSARIALPELLASDRYEALRSRR